ncbi:MAG: hypothetical protein ABF504_11070, partial [Komagataeibacter saccharivorans]|uniref:hypothetical protein n=1 Tax=Komagataeibacter saccharivorans TaxID=265959 RepID=UPI0039E86145
MNAETDAAGSQTKAFISALRSPFHNHAGLWHVKLRWLLAPSPADMVFALRTSLAAALSLLIAMWMELDSPQ